MQPLTYTCQLLLVENQLFTGVLNIQQQSYLYFSYRTETLSGPTSLFKVHTKCKFTERAKPLTLNERLLQIAWIRCHGIKYGSTGLL